MTVRTLLIEDEPDAVRLYRTIMARAVEAFYVVEDVPTMAQARSTLAENHLDLILLDLKLPNGAGVCLIREIKSLAPHAALVVITGMSGDDIERDAFALFCDDFILKAREGADEILRICRKAVARAKARNDLCASTPANGLGLADKQLEKWVDDPRLAPHSDPLGIKVESDKQQDTVLEPKRK